jgi:hypothetical protein
LRVGRGVHCGHALFGETKVMDLSLVPINELADELMKRGKVGIVYVHGLEGRQGYVNWIGDYYAALGLCIDMQREIMEEFEDK